MLLNGILFSMFLWVGYFVWMLDVFFFGVVVWGR